MVVVPNGRTISKLSRQRRHIYQCRPNVQAMAEPALLAVNTHGHQFLLEKFAKVWRSPDGDKRNMQQVYQFSRPSSYQQSAIEKPILQERSNAKVQLGAPPYVFWDVGQRSFTSPLHHSCIRTKYHRGGSLGVPNRTQGPNPVPFSAQGPHGRTDQAASSWEQRAHREPVEALSLVHGEHVMAQDQKKVYDKSYHLPVCCVHA